MKNSWKRFLAFTFALCFLTSSVPVQKNIVSFAEDTEITSENVSEEEMQPETEESTEIFTESDDISEPEEQSVTAETEEVQSESGIIEGEWGENITYKLNTDTGELVVSGTGDMKDSSNMYASMPFYSYKDVITSAVFEEGITSICNYALLYCAALTSVSLPSTLEKIDYSAFEGCTSLQSVEIPDSVKEIGKEAFRGCDALSAVSLPDSLETIGEYAFYECIQIQSLVIPGNIENIDGYAFSQCTNLQSVEISGSVETLGGYAFYGCSALESFNVTGSLSSVGSYAFSGCDLLSDVTLSQNLRTIGDYAFFSCSSLKAVTLYEGLTSIGESAFADCYALLDINIPLSIEVIGNKAFENTPFEASQANEWLITESGVLYEYRGTATEIVIPDGVKSIATGLFRDKTDITSVTLPDTLEGISAECFSGCTSLSVIVIPDNIKSVDDKAFYQCTSLTAVSLPDGTEFIGESAFSGCENLENITVPQTVNKVGAEAFADTPFLKNIQDDMIIFGSALYAYNGNESSVTVPDGITSITDEAFIFHMNLEKVILPDTLVSIGNNVFLGCHAMNFVIVPENVTEIGTYTLGYYCNNGYSGSFEKMSSFSVIGKTGSAAETYATENDLNFISMDIEDNSCGENLTYSIDFNAGTLTISGTGTMTDFVSSSYNEGDTVTPFYKFRSFIKSVVIEEGVTSIGEYAFYELNNVTSVVLPSTLTEIKKRAFYGVSSLEEINLPDGLETIGSSAFYNMKSLKNVTIPDTVISMGECAFQNCSALVSINIPVSLNSIEDDLLYGCSSLESVILDSRNTNFKEEDGIIYNSSKTEILIYPENLPLEKYTVPSKITRLPSSVFKAKNLRCLVIPKNVKRFSDSSYSDRIALRNPNSLERIVFLGDAPSISYYDEYLSIESDHSVTVTCSFSGANWKETMEQCTDDNIIWEDKDALNLCSTLTIDDVPESVKVGDSFTLKAKLNPLLDTMFNWTSDNENVAVVEKNGRVIIKGEGEATILCATSDSKYTCSVTLNAESSESGSDSATFGSYEYMELDEETVGKPLKSKQFPCEKLGGIYFLNGSVLSFCSFASKQIEWKQSFNYVSDCYECNGKLYLLAENQCQIFDIETRQITGSFSVPAGFNGSVIGADEQGRVYIYAKNSSNSVDRRVFLMNESGEVYSYTSAPVEFYSFDGFNSETGTFYMETYYDYYSWGYSHPGRALNMGIVVDNQIYCVSTSNSFLEQGVITRNFDCIEYLCQNVYFEHQNGAELLGNHYLVSRSPMTSTFTVRDSESLDTLMRLSRETVEYEVSSTYTDYSSVGARAVYNANHDSIIMYDNNMTITEYLPETQEVLSTYKVKDYVYSLYKMGDYVIAVEKSEDGKYSMELIEWKDPENLEITCEKTQMNISETQRLSISGTTLVDSKFRWTTSDKNIVSVTDTGVLTAWGEGEAVISCSSVNGDVFSEIKITVIPSDTPENKTVKSSDGTITNNLSRNNYTVYNSIADSFLTEMEDGNLLRVEDVGDNVITEVYTPDGSLLSSAAVEKELSIFGGFYSSDDAYYILTGQLNPEESDSVEVMRLTKYSKEWERIGSCSVYGANTSTIFGLGNASFAETDGKLYIHTCHEMYADSDGTNHQANMTFVIDTESMTLLESMTGVSVEGYVAHSFAQYIREDGEYIYRLDHGDGAPRAVSLSRISKDGSLDDVTNLYYSLYSIRGSLFSGNPTGVSVGGMELSDDNILVALNSVDMEAETYDTEGNRNIILVVASKNGSSSKQINITDYTEDDGITVCTPHITKLTSDAFMIMWEEKSTAGTVTKIITCNGDGTIINSAENKEIRLSDCQPVFTTDGTVKWYTTDSDQLTLYAVNPFSLESSGNSGSIPGDVNGDGVVNLKDTVLIRRYLAGGWDVTIDETTADVNGDGVITMKDVVLINRYLAGGWDVTLK